MADDLDYQPDLVSVSDDDGKEYTFEILDRIETDDGRYVALVEYFEDPEAMLNDDGDVMVLKVLEEDGESYLTQIEDENELLEISDIFEKRFAEMYEDDEETDET